jgi:hypothetical protein
MSDDWQRHLPPEDHAEMIRELAEAPARHLDAVIAAWRSTAGVYADPELHAALTRDLGDDGGPVPQPCGDDVPCTDDCSHGQAFRALVALDEELGIYDQPTPTPEDWREVRRQVAEERRGHVAE